MKVIIDDRIPYIRGALEPFAEVVYLAGNLISAETVRDADALVTRTRTACNKALLQGSKVKLIATATIGFDHIDTDYCRAAGVEWINAPGCNAESVNQYVASALFSYATRRGFALNDRTIGIVGVGQVGSRIARTAGILGMRVLLNDPPRARREGPAQFVSLQTIREQADIISFHVPLNREGIDRTRHMVDEEFLRDLQRKPLIINTCRGEVFATEAVRGALVAGVVSGAVIDCWENEPELDPELLRLADFGTAHIAGYSRDGKANGTRVSVRALSRFFGLGIDDWEPPGIEPPANPVIELDRSNQTQESMLAHAILASYAIADDDRALRHDPRRFEQLRDDYPVRREFACYSIKAGTAAPEVLEKLASLGFRVRGR